MSTALLLVVCGNTRRREDFVATLAGAGWQAVQSAPGLSEAASQMRNAANACVIIDAELADIPGLKAVQVLRNLCPHVKVIFTTPENTRDLEAEARALDVFYYYISSADKAELVAAVEDAIGSPRSGPTKHRPKVLIVDDDKGFHQVIRAILAASGYTAVSAYTEREGLEAARREKPDAILLDIIMESTTDGFEFCHEARRDPQIKHTPILGVSAIEERIALRCPPDRDSDLFPVDGYLKKPVVMEKLLAELRRLIPSGG
jgi:CheY-like chemotaxis protein